MKGEELWGLFLVVVIGLFVLAVFISGVGKLIREMRRGSAARLVIILSLFTFPVMLTTCSAINWLGEDKRDAYGFERPAYEGRSGPEMRSQRRGRAMENVGTYVVSAHGWASISTALLVGLPFLACMIRIEQTDRISTINGYWDVVVPLTLAALVVFGRS